jgi:hypothetical protein
MALISVLLREICGDRYEYSKCRRESTVLRGGVALVAVFRPFAVSRMLRTICHHNVSDGFAIAC